MSCYIKLTCHLIYLQQRLLLSGLFSFITHHFLTLRRFCCKYLGLFSWVLCWPELQSRGSQNAGEQLPWEKPSTSDRQEWWIYTPVSLPLGEITRQWVLSSLSKSSMVRTPRLACSSVLLINVWFTVCLPSSPPFPIHLWCFLRTLPTWMQRTRVFVQGALLGPLSCRHLSHSDLFCLLHYFRKIVFSWQVLLGSSTWLGEVGECGWPGSDRATRSKSITSARVPVYQSKGLWE